MKQEFVYHPIARPRSQARHARASAATATVALKEYVAYVTLLSIAVVIAIITFAYAANITVRWLDAVAKPGFFSTASVAHPGDTAVTPTKFAMLPAGPAASH
jgi:hypothetical protein